MLEDEEFYEMLTDDPTMKYQYQANKLVNLNEKKS